MTQLRGIRRVKFDIRLRRTALEDRRTLNSRRCQTGGMRRNTPLTVLRTEACRHGSEIIQTALSRFNQRTPGSP